MTPDPRAPVLIGVGQVRQRLEGAAQGDEPLALMEEAARLAAADSGRDDVLCRASAVYVPQGLWRYSDPAALLSARFGAEGAVTGLAPISGNMVQHMIGRAAREIVDGQRDLVVIVGGEAEHSKRRAKARGLDPGWTPQTDDDPDVRFAVAEGMATESELAVGLGQPVNFFSLYENALRHRRGETLEAHRERISNLWSGLSAVAGGNRHAWQRDPVDAETIRTPSEDNRMMAWPYPKRMCANMVVDLAAAVILCAEETADALGIARDRRVYLHASTDAMTSPVLSERVDFVSAPALGVAGRRALSLAGVGIDDVAHVDLYSCFPAAVQLGMAELGLAADRAVSVTGGLGFAGGPLNSYVLHSTATMVERLREEAGELGLVSSIGGWVSKHGFGVYGAEPPGAGFRFEDVEEALAALPTRAFAPEREGPARIETYALRFKGGVRRSATFSCLDAEGGRTWAVTDEPAVLEAMTTEEFCGREVRVRAGGRLDVG